ncbi:cadherin-like domain-containing protein, partial [Stappia sp. F7233]|nr:cadherin-like domain-containing protein [Stappia albiluteola]
MMTTGVETASAAEAASVEGGNELPVVTGVPVFSTLEETALVVSEAELLAFASDGDGDTLTVVGLVALGGLVSSNGDGTWTFVPDTNFTGTAELQYQVYDGTDYVSALATVTVAPVNDAPVVGVAAGGGEAGVNDHTPSHQNASAVARLDDGGYVVVWASNGQDGSGYGIYAQRYDADGTAAGSEFRVNAATANSQRQPAVAALAGGGFVVTWASTGDGSLEGVYQQRFDAGGAALGGQDLVNETIAGSQDLAQVAGLAGGGHVVVWRSARADGSGHDVYLRAYDAAGAALGGEALVSGGVAGEGNGQDLPVLAALSDGGVLVAWSSADGDGAGVFARRFDAAGNAAGAAFQVNSHDVGAQEEPAVAALADGGFVIAWRSLGQDGSS